MSAKGKSIPNSISKPNLKGSLATSILKNKIKTDVTHKEQDNKTPTTSEQEYQQMLADSTTRVDGVSSTQSGTAERQTTVNEPIPMVKPESSEQISEQIVSSFDKILTSYNNGDNLAALTEMRNVARENGLVSLGDEIEQQIQDFKSDNSSTNASTEQSETSEEQSLAQTDIQKPKDASQDPVLSGSIAQSNAQNNPFSFGNKTSLDKTVSQIKSDTSSDSLSISTDVGSGMSFG